MGLDNETKLGRLVFAKVFERGKTFVYFYKVLTLGFLKKLLLLRDAKRFAYI